MDFILRGPSSFLLVCKIAFLKVEGIVFSSNRRLILRGPFLEQKLVF
jgi:hypothetical protein